MSYPNQKKIKINKPKYKENYLQIGIDDWQEAYKDLEGNSSAFAMYLYLASNKDGYIKEMSAEAFKNAVGKSRSSYHRAIDILSDKGYIYEDNCSRLNFATTPKIGNQKALQNWEEDDSEKEHYIVRIESNKSHSCNVSDSRMTIEIENKYNKENKEIDNGAPFHNLSYLRKIVSPLGEYNSRWLEDEIPNLWDMDKKSQSFAISQFSDFDEKQSAYIAYHILDKDKRNKHYRLSDIEKMEDDEDEYYD